MAYFHCLIGGGSGGGYELTVTCDADFAGTTITATDGVTTLTQTCPSASPYEVVFEIPNGGEWTISGIISGQTYSASVDIPDSLELHSVPDGSTVTPTDDIQTWLACAGITDKSYTTLAEVLADSTTLLALMSDNNAVDYLVRSASWAGDESVKVPTMTSNTTPSGEVIYGTYSSSNYAYLAFDKNTSTRWNNDGTNVNEYIGYKFTSAVIVNKVKVYPYYWTGYALLLKSFKVQASNDNFVSDIHDLTNTITLENQQYPNGYEVEFENDTAYQYYRLAELTSYYTANNISISELYFTYDGITTNSTAMTDIGANNYCANTLLSDSTWLDAIANSTYIDSVLNVKVPTMTSNTTPSGVASASTTYVSYDPYEAFDKVYTEASSWASTTATNSWLQYEFAEPQIVKSVVITNRWGTYSSQGVNSFEVLASNDGFISDSHTLYSGSAIQTLSARIDQRFIFENTTAYKYYRLLAKTNYGNSATAIVELQFYGREDV